MGDTLSSVSREQKKRVGIDPLVNLVEEPERQQILELHVYDDGSFDLEAQTRFRILKYLPEEIESSIIQLRAQMLSSAVQAAVVQAVTPFVQGLEGVGEDGTEGSAV